MQIISILDYWDDFDADFLRFYGIDFDKDLNTIAPARFFSLMYRLPVYDGVISAIIQEEQKSKKHTPSKIVRDNPDVKMVDAKDLISFEQSTRTK